MTPGPAIYRGKLRHRRFRPTAHDFSYSLFMVLLDIDRIPETMKRSPFSSYNRFNWASFCERDHLDGSSEPLRQRLAKDAAAQDVTLPDGPVFLLTHLRYLGYCFNPISFFFFYDKEGGVPVVLAGGAQYFRRKQELLAMVRQSDWGDESLRFAMPEDPACFSLHADEPRL